MARTANCFLVLGLLSLLVWGGSGLVLRFRWAGKVCSGYFLTPQQKNAIKIGKSSSHYLLDSGQTIAIISLLLATFYSLLLCLGSCAFFSVCYEKNKAANRWNSLDAEKWNNKIKGSGAGFILSKCISHRQKIQRYNFHFHTLLQLYLLIKF